MTRNGDPTLHKIEETWSQIYIRMSEGQLSITLEKCMSKTDGIAAQVVVILYSLGWIPVSYDKWLDPEGDEWILASHSNEPFPVMPLIWKILHSYHKKQIEKASLHFDGSSLKDTIAWDMVRSKNKTLKNKKKFPELAILETAQAGACWPHTEFQMSWTAKEAQFAYCAGSSQEVASTPSGYAPLSKTQKKKP